MSQSMGTFNGLRSPPLPPLISAIFSGLALPVVLNNSVLSGLTIAFWSAHSLGLTRLRNFPHQTVVSALIISSCIPATASGLHGYFFSSSSTTIESPTDTFVPSKADAVLSALPYPPNALPGARDVDTPYGKVRAYEWGPEDGRKVLLVHGISTPCISLGRVAESLVQQGCRVMLFGKSLRRRHDVDGE